MSLQIKPCPFSGEPGQLFCNGPDQWWVFSSCVRGPVAATREQAVAAWNTRPQPSVEGEDGCAGYAAAFYEIADMLGIPSCAKSPREVWEQEMRPRLLAALSPPPQPAGGSLAPVVARLRLRAGGARELGSLDPAPPSAPPDPATPSAPPDTASLGATLLALADWARECAAAARGKKIVRVTVTPEELSVMAAALRAQAAAPCSHGVPPGRE